MRNILILTGIPLWLGWGVFWVFRLKLKLLKLHGFDKTNSYFLELAKQGDPMAKELYRRTKVFMAIGLVAGALMILTK